MNLAEIVSALEFADDSLCIVAKRPWTGESEAKLMSLTEDSRVPGEVLSAGYEYFLEVSAARDDVLSGPVALSKAQQLAAVIYYAEYDSYPDWLSALGSQR